MALLPSIQSFSNAEFQWQLDKQFSYAMTTLIALNGTVLSAEGYDRTQNRPARGPNLQLLHGGPRRRQLDEGCAHKFLGERSEESEAPMARVEEPLTIPRGGDHAIIRVVP